MRTDDCKRCFARLCGTGTYHDFEGPWLNHLFHFCVEHGKCFGSNGELDSLLFSGLERDSVKTLQLHHRPCNRRDLLMDVHLRDFVAVAWTGVAYIHADLRRSPRLNLRWLDAKVVKLECGVAQSKPKRIQRLPCAERIASV